MCWGSALSGLVNLMFMTGPRPIPTALTRNTKFEQGTLFRCSDRDNNEQLCLSAFKLLLSVYEARRRRMDMPSSVSAAFRESSAMPRGPFQALLFLFVALPAVGSCMIGMRLQKLNAFRARCHVWGRANHARAPRAGSTPSNRP